jgi:hypothetical protein
MPMKDDTPKEPPSDTPKEPPPRKVALRYVGNGASLPDVPARDLYQDEMDAYDRKALVASGLYEAA